MRRCSEVSCKHRGNQTICRDDLHTGDRPSHRPHCIGQPLCTSINTMGFALRLVYCARDPATANGLMLRPDRSPAAAWGIQWEMGDGWGRETVAPISRRTSDCYPC
eukprot:2962743-Amphidinium_carterae.2